ncbi:uncharacterized protein LOC129262337 [Lytechinus pictus]|uniref:uncharacterized protein LOC129262337 n=1 Tax=Lytechinus pictus TaxID=7653 RepID=UPI0030B9E581
MACSKYTQVILLVLSVIIFSHLQASEAIRIEQGPTNATVGIGELITLICDVTDQSVNTILWYHASKNVFISEGGHVYNNEGLPRNYNVLVDEGVRSFNLQIIHAEIENTGWYECGYLNSMNIYKRLGNSAYVNVRVSHRPPEMILSPPVCTVAQIPMLPGQDSEVDIVCSWINGGPNTRPSLFWNGAPIGHNITLANRIIGRIVSSHIYGFACGLVLANSTVSINSTCDVISGRIARIRMDPLINDVYEGNVANFSCSIDGHGLNPIDLLITKDGKNLGRSSFVDSLNVQFTPVLQENNTVLVCIASDLPGTMITVESVLRILPALQTTTDTTSTSLTNSTDANTVTPTFASSMKARTLYMIIIIVASMGTMIFCILAVVGVCARRRRRKVALLQANYTSELSVELVETTLVLDESDEQEVKNTTDDVSAYAVSVPSTSDIPEVTLRSPPLTTSSETPIRRSSLPDQKIHYHGLEDSITKMDFRDRKQSEPFVVYAKPLEMNLRKWASQGVTPCGSDNDADIISVVYAKPEKPKIRKWASQGTGAFVGIDFKEGNRDPFHRKASEPGSYAVPDGSKSSLDTTITGLGMFPQYAKPNKKGRRYISQKVGKSSVSKTRKWMSMSKERVDIDNFSKVPAYSEVTGLSHGGYDDTSQMEESPSVPSRESESKTKPDVPFSKSRSLPSSSPLYADPEDFTGPSASLRYGGYDKVNVIQSSIIQEVRERLSKNPHYESIPVEKELANRTKAETTTSSDNHSESSTTSVYETEAEGTTQSYDASPEDSYEVIEANSLDSLLSDEDDDDGEDFDPENDSENETQNSHYQMTRLKQIL